MKTIATFSTVEEAYNLRAFLANNGMTAFVRDENMAASYSMAIGGVKLDVEDEDFDRATALYASVSDGRATTTEPESGTTNPH